MTNSKGKPAFKAKDPKKTLMRLFSYYKYYKGMFLFGILAIIFASLAEVAATGMLSPIIDVFASGGPLNEAIGYMLIMAGFVLIVALGQYAGNRAMTKLAQRIIHKIREDMFAHMEKLPVSYFDTHSHGELMSTFTNDVDMLNQSLEQAVSQIIVSIVTVVGTFIIMMIISPILTLVVALMLAFMFVLIKYIGSKSANYFRNQQLKLADMNGYIEEMMTGQKVVKVFNYEKRAMDDFANRNDELRKSSALASTFGVMLMPIMGNLTLILYSIIAILGSFLVIKNTLSVGNIAAFLQFTRTISRPITMVSNQLNQLFAAIAGAERIFNILDEEVEMDEGDVTLIRDCNGKGNHCWKAPLADGNFEIIPVNGDITFKGVDFGYTPGQKVLKNINLYARPGQKIAFVGSTGAGKTTITNLINRFYEINEGTILVDGVDIRRINKVDLRSTMSIVLQDVHLFEGTVADNIRYGRLDATDEEIKEAAKLANAHYFIRHLPHGYDTMLTIDGQNLSQGERQLLSIARAAIADPEILILDEATSSVDTRTEKLISEGMDKLMKGRTTFVIAHRLSTVRDSNAIMVLENGEIMERGDHDDLMAQKGRYFALNAGTIELD
ncbi:MAG: ABC transporter ATP-binding protein [Peptostreptococcales bacterium]